MGDIEKSERIQEFFYFLFFEIVSYDFHILKGFKIKLTTKLEIQLNLEKPDTT